MSTSRKCFVKDIYISTDACEDFKAVNDTDVCDGCSYLDIELPAEEQKGNKTTSPSGNRLGDLNDHLFAQLGRLTDKYQSSDKLVEEIERSKAVGNIAKTIIDNAKLVLDAQKSLGNGIKSLPRMIGDDSV